MEAYGEGLIFDERNGNEFWIYVACCWSGPSTIHGDVIGGGCRVDDEGVTLCDFERNNGWYSAGE